MSVENLGNLAESEKSRLREFIDRGVELTRDMELQKEGLRDLAKALAKDLDIKPALLMKSLRVAYKTSLEDEREKFDAVETILEVAKGI